MKRLILLSIALFATTLGAFAFSSDDLNKVSFVNNLSGGRTIDYIFFSPGDSKYWGPDVLDKEHSLESGEKKDFFVFYPESSGKFDFMAIDGDGKVYEIKDVVITDSKPKTISVTDKAKTSKTLESLKLSEVVLTNKTDQAIDYVFLAPADSVIWGIELLSTERSLEPGSELSFVVPLAEESFDMDFLAIGANDNHYEKTVSVGTDEEKIPCSVSESDLKNEKDK